MKEYRSSCAHGEVGHTANRPMIEMHRNGVSSRRLTEGTLGVFDTDRGRRHPFRCRHDNSRTPGHIQALGCDLRRGR